MAVQRDYIDKMYDSFSIYEKPEIFHSLEYDKFLFHGISKEYFIEVKERWREDRLDDESLYLLYQKCLLGVIDDDKSFYKYTFPIWVDRFCSGESSSTNIRFDHLASIFTIIKPIISTRCIQCVYDWSDAWLDVLLDYPNSCDPKYEAWLPCDPRPYQFELMGEHSVYTQFSVFDCSVEKICTKILQLPWDLAGKHLVRFLLSLPNYDSDDETIVLENHNALVNLLNSNNVKIIIQKLKDNVDLLVPSSIEYSLDIKDNILKTVDIYKKQICKTN